MKKKVTLIQSVWIVIITLTCATLLILISGASPIEAISLFFNGIFGSLNGSMEVFVKATPLIFTGLACAVAFRTGFFNIGAEGQFYIGALASAFVVLQFDSVSGVGRILLAFIAGFIGGGIWALIAAFLKSKFGISEIIVTIMLNYIAINIVGIAVRTFMMDPNGNLPQSAKIDKSVWLMQVLKPTRLHIGFFIAIAVVILVWIVLEKTTIGYELRAVGYNKRGAACNGISITKNIILSSFKWWIGCSCGCYRSSCNSEKISRKYFCRLWIYRYFNCFISKKSSNRCVVCCHFLRFYASWSI